MKNKGLERDLECIEVAKNFVVNSNKNLFIALMHIDSLGHIFGNDKERITDGAKEILAPFIESLDYLNKKNQLGKVVIISDHGMVNVHNDHIIDPKFEYTISGFGDKWMCYYDSLYLKIWSDDRSLLKKFRLLLSKYPGKILDMRERKKAGASSIDFGNILYILNEGYAFAPNFFGRGTAKGYHGYMTNSDEHNGVFISQEINSDTSNLNPIKVFEILKNL